jgi:cysteinyl-tRNA synthetase
MFEDVLKRVLRFNGFDVNHVMNVTDVGHLVSDADEGEDKMEKGVAAHRQDRVGGRRVLHVGVPRGHAPAQHRGPAGPVQGDRPHRRADRVHRRHRAQRLRYVTRDGVYFDTAKLDDYGYLARLDIEGSRPAIASTSARSAAPPTSRCGSSRRPASSARWNGIPRGAAASRAGTSSARRWRRSTWATSSTSTAAARTTSRSTTPTRSRRPKGGSRRSPDPRRTAARELLDARLLPARERREDGEVGGRFLRLATLDERGVDPLAYRYLCLTAHYRSQLNFTWEALDAAATGLDRMRHGFRALPDERASPDAAMVERFTDEINDDLNLPRALAVAWETLRGDLAPAVKRATLARFDEVFGLGLAAWTPKVDEAPRKRRRSPTRGSPRARQGLGRGRPPARRAAGAGLGDRGQARRLCAEAPPGAARVKLATLDDGTRDGALVVVSRHLARAVAVPEIARTLQHALDDWTRVAPALLRSPTSSTRAGCRTRIRSIATRARAPLPRAYQWADGSAYVNHVELVRRARGATMPPEFWTDPLMYQGASDHMLGPARTSCSPTRPGASTSRARWPS